MNKMHHLAVISSDSQTYKIAIDALNLNNIEINYFDKAPVQSKTIEQADIIFGQPAEIVKVLPFASNVEWIQSTFAGIEPLMQDNLPRHYCLTNIKGVFGPLMSEYVFAYILAKERSLIDTYHLQLKKQWQSIPYRSLQGLSMGIAGLGSIGSHLVKTAKHFGLNVHGLNRNQRPIDGVDKIFATKDICTFVQNQDFIVNTLPNTPETRHLFNHKVFSCMKSSATFINIGRGESVNSQDLMQALENNILDGAILDVFENEPLPRNHELWTAKNIMITPHNSAVSFVKDTVGIFAENYRRFTVGDDLLYQVDFSASY